jgi:type II secretory ATPase GspE/PulE/Tfp pilus assembly ATPase PilB-like protein
MSAAGTAAVDTVLSSLARALVQNQLIRSEEAMAVQEKVDAAQGRFIDELVSSGQMRAVTLARFASDSFGLPLMDLATLGADVPLKDLVDPKLLAETLILPIAKRGNRLTVLLSDPTDLQAIDRVKFRAQAPVDPIVVEHDKLLKFVAQLSQSLTEKTNAVDDEDASGFQREDADRAGTKSAAGSAADDTVLSGLARALVQNQLILPEEATAIQKKASAAQGRFIDELVSSGQMRAVTLARFASDTFGLPLMDLATLDADVPLKDLVDPKLLAETLILPIAKRGNRLTVLLSDPTDLQAIDRVKFRAQAPVDPIVVEHDKLLKFVAQLSQSLTEQMDRVDDDDAGGLQTDAVDDDGLGSFQMDAVDDDGLGSFQMDAVDDDGLGSFQMGAVDDDGLGGFQREDADRAGTKSAAGSAADDTVLSGLARALVQNQLILPEEATAIQKKASAAQGRFIDELVSSGQMRAVTLARFASDSFGLPLMDLATLGADVPLKDLVDPKLLAETLILPIAKRGNRLTVLLSDPTDLQAIDRVKFRAQAPVDPIVVEHDKLLKLVAQLSQSLTEQMDRVDDDDAGGFELEDADRAGTKSAADDTVLSDLARALVQNQLIRPEEATAIQKKASAAQRRFIDELVSSGQMRAVTLARFASDSFGLPLMDLATLGADVLLKDLLDPKLLDETLILPIAKRGNRLTVLLSDPTDRQAIDRVKFRAQASIDPIVVEHDKLMKLVAQLSQSLTEQMDAVDDDDAGGFQREEADRAGTKSAADDTVPSGLARALIQNQLIRPEEATAIQKKASAAQRRFIDELVSSGQMRAVTLARFASDTFGLPLMDLATLGADVLLKDLVDPKLLDETLILPISKRGNRLTVLLSDPTDLQAIDRVKFRAQAPVDPIVVEHDKLLKFVAQLSQALTDQLKPAEEDILRDIPIGMVEDDIRMFDEDTPLRAATPK